MSGPKRPLAVTPAQTAYLLELVEDDLAETELTTNERQQARAVQRKLHELKHKWKVDDLWP